MTSETSQILPIDTVESRHAIGFKGRTAWTEAPAIFDQKTLKIDGHPVMEEWERPYMKSLANVASLKGGDTLEVGYGMGISASYILANPQVTSHSVIECHPDVMRKAVDDQRKSIGENRFHLLGGFWQDIVPKLATESYQGILFDSYPLTKEEIHKNHFTFFEEAYRLLKPGGKLAYYSDEEVGLSPEHLNQLMKAGFSPDDIDYGICEVPTPKDCKYWQAKSFLVPVITKPEHPRPMDRTHSPIMRVAINSQYHLTEIQPEDKVQPIPFGTLKPYLELAIRQRSGNKQSLGSISITGTNKLGEATIGYVFQGHNKSLIAPALASAIKYSMQHFAVKSFEADLKLKPTLEQFGFTEHHGKLRVDELTLREKLTELGFPKGYSAIATQPQSARTDGNPWTMSSSRESGEMRR